MIIFLSIAVFIFGLAIGSFLNAWVWRLEAGESVLKGRSHCTTCRHQLLWQDLIPLLSYAVLRGRCRYCKQRISFQYPLVELGTGTLFLLTFLFPPFVVLEISYIKTFSQAILAGVGYAYIFSIISFLVAIAVADIRRYIIPDAALVPALAITVAWHLGGWALFHTYTFTEIGESFVAALGALGFFLAIFLISRGQWLGFGDVKFSFFTGLFLGFPNIIPALFVAFWSGAIIGIILMVVKRKTLRSRVPFGPFLIFGTLIALFLGQELTQVYLRLFGI